MFRFTWDKTKTENTRYKQCNQKVEHLTVWKCRSCWDCCEFEHYSIFLCYQWMSIHSVKRWSWETSQKENTASSATVIPRRFPQFWPWGELKNPKKRRRENKDSYQFNPHDETEGVGTKVWPGYRKELTRNIGRWANHRGGLWRKIGNFTLSPRPDPRNWTQC